MQSSGGPARGVPTVLIVDDDDSIREAVSDVLASEGFRVLEAWNGTQALQLLATEKSVDVILLDMMMPGVDGWATLERLRNDAELATIPVVVMTATSRGRGDAPGVSAVLPKPFSIDALLEVVRRVSAAPSATPPVEAAERTSPLPGR